MTNPTRFDNVENRLDRVERLTEANAQAIDALRQRQETTQGQLDAFIRQSSEDMNGLMQLMRLTLVRLDENSTFVRGLQTENRRILERLERLDQGGE
ncbi:hypothetical protein [Anthocerotibacter panamensis]|uniref:hypothetical protein n=1 Tax=Anthocerotibacter panamensis TaxID=2857077 RepID=UPI001C402C3D|nr:hypothetical protein [Anthocerotibacter panamensis]